MTPKQKQLLEFIRDYVAERGLPPTFEEMRLASGLASKSGVARLVDALVDEGLLLRSDGKQRGLRLPMPNLAAVPTAVLSAELARRERGQ